MVNKRIVAIDYGRRRLGLSISDPMRIIASNQPPILSNGKLDQTIDVILKVLQPYEIERILIGHPISMNGRSNPMSLEVENFAKQLEFKSGIPCLLIDERLSTMQADRFLKNEADLNRKQRAAVIDSASAGILLQSYLNRS